MTTASAGLSRADRRLLCQCRHPAPLVGADQGCHRNLHINGTPGFTLNGQVLGDVHDWPSLAAALDGALAKPAGTQ
jgi:hypothetical protein